MQTPLSSSKPPPFSPLAFIGLDMATTTAAKLGITAVATLAGIALLASIIAAHTGGEARE